MSDRLGSALLLRASFVLLMDVPTSGFVQLLSPDGQKKNSSNSDVIAVYDDTVAYSWRSKNTVPQIGRGSHPLAIDTAFPTCFTIERIRAILDGFSIDRSLFPTEFFIVSRDALGWTFGSLSLIFKVV